MDEGPLGLTRRRIHRPGVSHRLIRPCERGGGRAGVRKDPSKGSKKPVSHSATFFHTFTHKIGVIGVRAKGYVGIRCVTLGHISGELPELSVYVPTSEYSRTPDVSSTHTFSLPNKTYPFRKLLGVFRSGRDSGDKAEPKLILARSIKIQSRSPVVNRRTAYHFGEPFVESSICYGLLVSHGRRVLRDA